MEAQELLIRQVATALSARCASTLPMPVVRVLQVVVAVESRGNNTVTLLRT